MFKNRKIFVLSAIFILIVSGIVLSLKFEQIKTGDLWQKEKPSMNIPDDPYNPPGNIDIRYIYLDSFNGKTKEEILKLRKQYVATSIFANNYYEPSEEVFGEIESGKPWIANNICLDPETSASRTIGTSEESRFISNPSILVALEHPFNYEENNYQWCTNDVNTMQPEKVLYNDITNEISVFYKKLPFTTENGSFYTFNGLNARDFGLKYAYVDLSKSTYQPEFANEENVSNTVTEFQNFIHVGNSCGVEGGCNNGSPHQPMLNFYYNREMAHGEYGTIYIKLWRNPPASPEDEADIIEKIILKSY